MRYALGERRPLIDPSAWVAESATVLGDVTLAADVGVWFGAVLRGDNEPIRVGARSNIQDLACLHCDPDFPLTIGSEVTVGHGAIVHGCTIGDGALIGMGAILLNGAVVGAGALVAAGALVPEGAVIPPGMLAIGAPAKVIRPLSEAQQARLKLSAEVYVARARAARTEMQCLPETALASDR